MIVQEVAALRKQIDSEVGVVAPKNEIMFWCSCGLSYFPKQIECIDDCAECRKPMDIFVFSTIHRSVITGALDLGRCKAKAQREHDKQQRRNKRRRARYKRLYS